jgi:hypothetical protein
MRVLQPHITSRIYQKMSNFDQFITMKDFISNTKRLEIVENMPNPDDLPNQCIKGATCIRGDLCKRSHYTVCGFAMAADDRHRCDRARCTFEHPIRVQFQYIDGIEKSLWRTKNGNFFYYVDPQFYRRPPHTPPHKTPHKTAHKPAGTTQTYTQAYTQAYKTTEIDRINQPQPAKRVFATFDPRLNPLNLHAGLYKEPSKRTTNEEIVHKLIQSGDMEQMLDAYTFISWQIELWKGHLGNLNDKICEQVGDAESLKIIAEYDQDKCRLDLKRARVTQGL